MTKLHELLAVEPDLQKRATAILEEATVLFNKNQDRFTGHTRSLRMKDDDRSFEDADDEKVITTTVGDKLAYMSDMLAPYYNTVFRKEVTNQEAKADIELDGTVIAENIPATFLLGMETRLTQLRRVYENIPTLQPGVKWEADSTLSSESGVVYRSPEAISYKTEKVAKSKILVEPTEHHPAQIHQWYEDTPVGVVKTVKFSGTITPLEKSQMLTRIDNLIRAVKKARQRANGQKVTERDIGQTLLDYINAPLKKSA